MGILPATAATDVTGEFVTVVTANIAPILLLVGAFAGFKLIRRWVTRVSKG